jgi:hypothetical protein
VASCLIGRQGIQESAFPVFLYVAQRLCAVFEEHRVITVDSHCRRKAWNYVYYTFKKHVID